MAKRKYTHAEPCSKSPASNFKILSNIYSGGGGGSNTGLETKGIVCFIISFLEVKYLKKKENTESEEKLQW